MFRLKPIILALVVLILAFTGQAQSGIDEKSKSMNDFFGFNGLRLNNPELLYNQRYLRDSTYFYEKQDLDADFLLTRKVGFDYDNQGRLLVENEFEYKEGIWSESSKRIFNYNSDGLVEYSVNKTWNGSFEEYENDQRTFLYRNFLGLISEEIVELYAAGDWMVHSKREYLYNDYNKISEELSYEWLLEHTDWEPRRRTLYLYDQNEKLSSEVFQVWIDTLATWVNSSSRVYAYNDENQLINLSQSTWNKNLGQWIEQSFQALSYTPLGQIENSESYDSFDPNGDAKSSVVATYDENGNLNTTLFKEWNADQNAWSAYEKHEHFWSQYLIGNLDYTDKNIECFYVNPHTIGLPWYCKSLLKDETYTLSVFDHNGVLHHTQQFRGGDTFRLTKNLNNGLYMIVITGGLTIHTEKVIVRN